MRWYGKLLGAIAGWLLLRHPAGAILGVLIGHAFDSGLLGLGGGRDSATDDYRELDLPPSASGEEIERAYRRLMAQYHPDRLAEADSEFRAFAERRSRAINAAYRRLRKQRRKAN